MAEFKKENVFKIILIKELNDIFYDVKNKQFNGFTREQYFKYLKGKYSNKERFISRFIRPNVELIKEQAKGKDFDGNIIIPEKCVELILEFYEGLTIEEFENATPFTYSEAFEIKSETFQKAVFDTVDIESMMKELDAERVMVEGKESINKVFNKNGELVNTETIHNVYELYKANGEKLGLGSNSNLFAIKCWCTSTNNEHYIWVGEEYSENPLDAIASTFEIHENLLPYVKALKRQGDILVVELTEQVEPSGNKIRLTANQYFDLLESQS